MPGPKTVTPETLEFGRRLRALAARNGMKDEEAVAEALGITVHGVRAIYKGQNAQLYLRLADMARAIGATPDELLGFQTTQPPPAPEQLSVTTLVDLIAGLLIGEGWDEDMAEKAAEAVLQFAREPKPKVQNLRQWTRGVASGLAQRVRKPR